MDHEMVGVFPAEFAGMARLDGGVLDVGGVKLHLPVAWRHLPVYVRRNTDDLSIGEVLVVLDDSLAEEQLATENDEADRYVLGPREYWRSKLVGKGTYGPDAHPMTEEDFDEFWDEGEGE